MTNGKPITYRSTRGGDSGLSFEEAVFAGLASDGGLMVPDRIPDVSGRFQAWKSLSFGELAFELASCFVSESEIPARDLREIMTRSYQGFTHPEVVPSVPLGDFHVMELFHGPTFAFKDVALQALGNTYEYFLKRNKRRLTVVGATSGDTGSAAIYGLRGKENVECFILFPEGRVSQIQQQQMTSVLDSNVHCVAVQGSFDDCQDIVKGLFGDLSFKKKYGLGAVNSINWARIMFQITYYFYTYYKLYPGCDGQVSFSVPTGNFGDILAGYYAKRMGLPVRQLIVATNDNDILHRFFATGDYEKLPVHQTSTPSMDIGISSNFERYLFYLFGEDPKILAEKMAGFKETGKLSASAQELEMAREDFCSGKAAAQEVATAIKEYDARYGYCLDPHTACGVVAIDKMRRDTRWNLWQSHQMVVLGTAHPAKFGDTVKAAMGRPPQMPAALKAVENAPTRFEVLPNSVEQVRKTVEKTVARREGGLCSCFSGLGRLCE